MRHVLNSVRPPFRGRTPSVGGPTVVPGAVGGPSSLSADGPRSLATALNSASDGPGAVGKPDERDTGTLPDLSTLARARRRIEDGGTLRLRGKLPEGGIKRKGVSIGDLFPEQAADFTENVEQLKETVEKAKADCAQDGAMMGLNVVGDRLRELSSGISDIRRQAEYLNDDGSHADLARSWRAVEAQSGSAQELSSVKDALSASGLTDGADAGEPVDTGDELINRIDALIASLEAADRLSGPTQEMAVELHARFSALDEYLDSNDWSSLDGTQLAKLHATLDRYAARLGNADDISISGKAARDKTQFFRNVRTLLDKIEAFQKDASLGEFEDMTPYQALMADYVTADSEVFKRSVTSGNSHHLSIQLVESAAFLESLLEDSAVSNERHQEVVGPRLNEHILAFEGAVEGFGQEAFDVTQNMGDMIMRLCEEKGQIPAALIGNFQSARSEYETSFSSGESDVDLLEKGKAMFAAGFAILQHYSQIGIVSRSPAFKQATTDLHRYYSSFLSASEARENGDKHVKVLKRLRDEIGQVSGVDMASQYEEIFMHFKSTVALAQSGEHIFKGYDKVINATVPVMDPLQWQNSSFSGDSEMSGLLAINDAAKSKMEAALGDKSLVKLSETLKRDRSTYAVDYGAQMEDRRSDVMRDALGVKLREMRAKFVESADSSILEVQMKSDGGFIAELSGLNDQEYATESERLVAEGDFNTRRAEMLATMEYELNQMERAYLDGAMDESVNFHAEKKHLMTQYEAMLPHFKGEVTPAYSSRPTTPSAPSRPETPPPAYSSRPVTPSVPSAPPAELPPLSPLSPDAQAATRFCARELEIALYKQFASRHVAKADGDFIIQEFVAKLDGMLPPGEQLDLARQYVLTVGQTRMAEAQNYQRSVESLHANMGKMIHKPEFAALRKAAGPNADPATLLHALQHADESSNPFMPATHPIKEMFKFAEELSDLHLNFMGGLHDMMTAHEGSIEDYESHGIPLTPQMKSLPRELGDLTQVMTTMQSVRDTSAKNAKMFDDPAEREVILSHLSRHPAHIQFYLGTEKSEDSVIPMVRDFTMNMRVVPEPVLMWRTEPSAPPAPGNAQSVAPHYSPITGEDDTKGAKELRSSVGARVSDDEFDPVLSAQRQAENDAARKREELLRDNLVA